MTTNPIDSQNQSAISANPSLPLVAIREGIHFPHTESVLNFARDKSVKAVETAENFNHMLILVGQKNPKQDEPQEKDLYTIGTLVTIEKTLKTSNQVNCLIQGQHRVLIKNISLSQRGHFMAEYEMVGDIYRDKDKIDVLSKHLSKLFNQAVAFGKPVEFLNFMKLMSGVNAGELADQIASTLQISDREKQKILETLDVEIRLEVIISKLSKELNSFKIERDIINKTQQNFDKHMKESILRERMKTIRKELGEEEDEEDELDDLRKKIKAARLPEKVAKKVSKELKRLEKMSLGHPEAGYIRNYLDTILDLPWRHQDSDRVSLKKAQAILDQHHFGLKDVKERILEYLAVLQLKKRQSASDQQNRQPTILCFVGAPGVGKTSLGRSIAQALGRKFVKVSLGGIRDEAEIRGHRRTYVGAMPGRIISGMISAASCNPVFMLDEIDKLGTDFRGDPSSALLEALDPEQNTEFSDHYLEVPFDLSKVMFITTANTLSTIPPALRDRLEVIEYSGYTQEEKLSIAKHHLWGKILKNNGFSESELSIEDKAIEKTIDHYTKEAGVRNLERQLSKLVRKIAKQTALKQKISKKIVLKQIGGLLGPEIFEENLAEKKPEVGLATGLAWTSVGGDVLFIEVTLTPGKGQVVLTGTLGDVMKESAQIALTYVKAHAAEFKISDKKLKETNVHLHVPEGAVPKDGPSAGITMTTAMISAFTKRKVNSRLAMTGEITLRGKILPIGGLKEKLIAAVRSGCKEVIIPNRNLKDLVEVPDSVKHQIKIHPVESMDQVLKLALV